MESKFLWEALGKPDCPEYKKNKKFETCCICGLEQGNIKKSEIVSSSFTNFDLFRNINDSVCDYCAIVAREPLFRRSSFIAYNDHIVEMKRDQIEEKFFNIENIPFCFYITTSFKKLGQYKVKINNDKNNFIVQFEELKVDVYLPFAKKIYEVIEDFYSIKTGEEDKKQPASWFSKEEIKNNWYKPHKIRAYGIELFYEKEALISEYRYSPLFDLLIYICNKKNKTTKKTIEDIEHKKNLVKVNDIKDNTKLVQDTFF